MLRHYTTERLSALPSTRQTHGTIDTFTILHPFIPAISLCVRALNPFRQADISIEMNEWVHDSAEVGSAVGGHLWFVQFSGISMSGTKITGEINTDRLRTACSSRPLAATNYAISAHCLRVRLRTGAIQQKALSSMQSNPSSLQ